MPTYTLSPKTAKYRYVTPDHLGKWYPSLEEAQRHSVKIGAGFFDEKAGEFFAYPGTRLEIYEPRSAAESARKAAFPFGTDTPAAA